jgi:alanine racemase
MGWKPGAAVEPMNPNPHVHVRVDLERIRQNVRDIAERSGVPVIAVVKADAYGLGAREVAGAIGELVEAFYVFDAREAAQYELHALTGKRTIALLAESDDPQEYIAHRVNPCVWTEERARALRTAGPVVSVDTGQQRFACAAEAVAEVVKAGDVREAMTHASTLAQAAAFDAATRGMPLFRHAAGSRLLDEPAARFDAARPGLAIYRGAARVAARLIDARDGNGPAGYTGFVCPRFGVIRCGYSNRFRAGGPCLVNGRRRRVLEVGMQSAFVELGPGDRCGDEVVLLGKGLTEDDVAAAWGVTPQEALLRLCSAGVRSHA